MDTNYNDYLFFSIWRNIFLRKYIFIQLNLLYRNKKVRIESLEELKNHKLKKYIEKIVYCGDDIIDSNILLDYDILKCIEFKYHRFEMIPPILPMGLKTLIFPIIDNPLIHNYKDIEICNLSSIPNSITDVRNVYANYQSFSIPSNIKRIDFKSFSQDVLCKCIINRYNENNTENELLELGLFIDESKKLNYDLIPRELIKRLHMEGKTLDIGTLPRSLTKLKLDIRLEIIIQDIDFLSFKSLKTLVLVSTYKIEIFNHVLPQSITKLKLDSPYIRIGQKSLPSGLLFLSVSDTIINMVNNNWIPLSLKKLIIKRSLRAGWFGSMYSRLIIHHVNLPPKLVHLQFEDKGFGTGDNQILTPGCIPKSLTYLNFGLNFNQEIFKNALPNLVEIDFGSRFNRYLDPGVLPKESLKKLTLSKEFNKKLEVGALPDSITHLIFGYNYDQPIISLPSSLTCLELNCPKYSHKIDTPHLFPPSLSKLVLSKNFKKKNLISSDFLYSIECVIIE
ncbi:hypothetical protein ACTA71_010185 [Dictyostelium dimigraforme]